MSKLFFLLDMEYMNSLNKSRNDGINKAGLPPWGELAECFIGWGFNRDTELVETFFTAQAVPITLW